MKKSHPVSVVSKELVAAVKNNNEHLVNVLIRNKANVNSKNAEGFSCLHLAVINNNPRIVQALLAAKADPTISVKTDRGNWTPCLYASLTEPPAWDCVEVFARNYADRDDSAGFGSVLFIATRDKKFDIAQLLLRAKARTNPALRLVEILLRNLLRLPSFLYWPTTPG